MILARTLTRAGLGRLQEVNVHLQVVLNILTVGIQTGLYNFLPRVELVQRRAYVWKNLEIAGILALCAGVLACAVATSFAAWVGAPEAVPLVRVASVALVASILATVADPLFIVHERADLSAAATVASAAVQVGCVAAWVGSDQDASIFFIAVACGQFLRFLWGVVFVASVLPRGGKKPDRNLYWEQAAFVAPVLVTATLDTLSSNLDRLIIARLFDAASMAVYTNGAVELPFIGVLIGAVTAVLLPTLAEKLEQQKLGEAHELWKRAVAKSAVILFGLFWLFVWIAEEFIVFLFSPRYRESAEFFRIYLILLPFRAIAFMPMLYALGKARTVLAGAVLDLCLNLLLSLALIKGTPLGMAGAAWGTVIATFVQSIYYLRAICYGLGVSWSALLPWRDLGGSFGLAGLWMLPLGGTSLLATPAWGRLALATLLGSTYAAFVVFPKLRVEGPAHSRSSEECR